jgi:hypothetical protein
MVFALTMHYYLLQFLRNTQRLLSDPQMDLVKCFTQLLIITSLCALMAVLYLGSGYLHLRIASRCPGIESVIGLCVLELHESSYVAGMEFGYPDPVFARTDIKLRESFL